MPRQRIPHGRMVYVLSSDFPQRLKRLQRESGLPWAEIARRVGTSEYTVWRWHECGVRPNFQHQMALLELAESLGLGHLLTAWTLPEEAPPAPDVPVRPRSSGRKRPNRRA